MISCGMVCESQVRGAPMSNPNEERMRRNVKNERINEVTAEKKTRNEEKEEGRGIRLSTTSLRSSLGRRDRPRKEIEPGDQSGLNLIRLFRLSLVRRRKPSICVGPAKKQP